MSVVDGLLKQRQYLLNALEALTGGPECNNLTRAVNLGVFPSSAIFECKKWVKRAEELIQPAGEQPAPVQNDSRPVWELVIEDMEARDKIGEARYGTRLQAHNGRNALRDAYEEALDLCVYLRTKMVENEDAATTERNRIIVQLNDCAELEERAGQPGEASKTRMIASNLALWGK